METDEVLADLVEDGQRAVVARWTSGRGNLVLLHLETQHQTLVKMVSREELDVTLELKLLADVGLVDSLVLVNQHYCQ